MSARYSYIPIDRIFSKLIRDLGEGFIIEKDVIEWTGEALEFIQAVKSFEEAVAYIEVENYQCKLPAGTHSIIQIARNNNWTKQVSDLCPQLVSSEVTVTEDAPAIPVALDCNGQPINDYELAYYRPYFDLKYEYGAWCGCGYYRRNYTPVRLATSTFFNTIVCRERDYDSIYQGVKDEYTVINKEILRFSFKEGSVAVALLRQVLDPETGYPMIPDNISYTTAITKYITLKIFEKHFYNGREGSQAKMQKAEQDWQWYCKQASNVDMMPYGIDEHQNLLDQRSYILPRQNQYFSFFGNLANPEGRKFNDPDHRNWGRLMYRGN